MDDMKTCRGASALRVTRRSCVHQTTTLMKVAGIRALDYKPAATCEPSSSKRCSRFVWSTPAHCDAAPVLSGPSVHQYAGVRGGVIILWPSLFE